MVAPAILSALKALAPAAIRAAGNLLGGKANDAAEVVADVIDSEGDLEGAMRSMPPELQAELARIANEAQKLSNERAARELQHVEALSGQVQATAQAEQQYGSDVSKRVRPETARESFRWTMFYVVTFEALEAAGYGAGATWELALLGMSPCLAYFGVRTFDKWKGRIGTVQP